MADQWVSVAEAAASLKVHPRTIERRIATGKINSRRSEEGQVQVLVDLPDIAVAQAATPQAAPQVAQVAPVAPVASVDPLETVKDMADRQVDIAAGSASALVRIAQDNAHRAQAELVLARQESYRARRNVQVAFASVGAMAVAVMVAIGWCAHVITEARSDARAAALSARQTEMLAKQTQTERDAARERLEASLVAQSKAEGELVAYVEQQKVVAQANADAQAKLASMKPTTRPSTFVDRLAQAFAN